MRTPPLLADFSHARACKPFCENSLTLPHRPEGRIFRAVNIQIDLALQSYPRRTQIVDGHIRMAVLCVIQDSHFVVIEVNPVDKSIH